MDQALAKLNVILRIVDGAKASKDLRRRVKQVVAVYRGVDGEEVRRAFEFPRHLSNPQCIEQVPETVLYIR
jgi:hypothetical protein